MNHVKILDIEELQSRYMKEIGTGYKRKKGTVFREGKYLEELKKHGVLKERPGREKAFGAEGRYH